MRRFVGLTLLLLGAVGCGNSAVTGVAIGGNGAVVISVGSGTTPILSWTGGNATQLTVSPNSGGAVLWNIQALSSQSGFNPPVVYGVVPSEARQNGAFTPLVQGIDYRVTVNTTDGSSGTRIFRP